MTEDKRQMKASEIPAFVDEVIGAGCNITAVGHDRSIGRYIDLETEGTRH